MIGNAAENIYPMNDEIEIPPMEDGLQISSGSDREPVVFGLMSATGGTGVTSIAIQMAYNAAKGNRPDKDGKLSTARQRVALLSLDFENSAMAYYLDAQPKISAEHFCQSPNVMESQHCLGWMTQTNYGFDVLVLPNSIEGNSRVNPNSVLYFLDQVAQNYDIIILDIPRLWMKWTHAALATADKLAFVTELNIPAINMTRERYAALMKTIESISQPEIILNKYEKKALRNSLSLSDANKSFLNIVVHPVSASADKMREAINRGEPLGHGQKKNKAVNDVNEVFDKWVEACGDNADELFFEL